jgi:hypothetical protein
LSLKKTVIFPQKEKGQNNKHNHYFIPELPSDNTDPLTGSISCMQSRLKNIKKTDQCIFFVGWEHSGAYHGDI